jgi:hypothetical protein
MKTIIFGWIILGAVGISFILWAQKGLWEEEKKIIKIIKEVKKKRCPNKWAHKPESLVGGFCPKCHGSGFCETIKKDCRRGNK